eukprot:8081715-Karenia_brevis.AAC.1
MNALLSWIAGLGEDCKMIAGILSTQPVQIIDGMKGIVGGLFGAMKTCTELASAVGTSPPFGT